MTKPRAICVYCGSSGRGPPAHREAAIEFGRLLAREGITLVYGGGHVGLMGQIADAVLSNGGRVVGVIPDHLVQTEVGHGAVSELVVVPSMHDRKRIMFERADAFVALPGGPGTLDETFEILTWRQLGLHDKPLIIANFDGYWSKLLALIDHMIETRYATRRIYDLFDVVERVDQILPAIIAAAPSRMKTDSDRL
jgi:uncharacterized protein (TIGR00730 family)